MTRAKLIVLSLFAGPLACSSGGTMNIGETQGSQLSDYAAQWDGYAEAYSFQPSGSDRVRLVLDADGSGTLRVGDDALLPPPSDPSIGYPAGVSSNGFDLEYNPINLHDNFLYPTHATQVQSDRIQVGFDPMDVEAAWCALQTPVAQDPGSANTGYGCVPNTAGSFDGTNCYLNDANGVMTAVDCGKVALCRFGTVCTCTAPACGIPTAPAGQTAAQYPAELDGALDSTGLNLTGTLSINGTRVTVHLQRQ